MEREELCWTYFKGKVAKIKTFTQEIEGQIKHVWLDSNGLLNSVIMESGVNINGQAVETIKEI